MARVSQSAVDHTNVQIVDLVKVASRQGVVNHDGHVGAAHGRLAIVRKVIRALTVAGETGVPVGVQRFHARYVLLLTAVPGSIYPRFDGPARHVAFERRILDP